MSEIHLIDTQLTPEEYNTAALHPLQSWQWGEARKSMGTDVLRLAEYANKSLNHVFQITLHPIPYTPFQIAYIPRSILPTADLLDYLVSYGKKHNIVFFKFEPDTNNTSEFRKEVNTLQKTYNLKKSPHQLFPTWTMVLDLTPTEEELFQNLKSKTRYNIRLAQKKGVTVKELSTDEGFEMFSELYFNTTKRQHYYGHNKDYHIKVWKTLKDSIAHVLVASLKKEPLAAYELFLFKDILYYPYGGSSDKHRNVMAANLLMWEAIRFGKKHNVHQFDMWGSSSPDYDPNDSYSGFTKFKEGYNAQFVEKIGSYDLIINPAIYTAYNFLHVLRTAYLKIRS